MLQNFNNTQNSVDFPLVQKSCMIDYARIKLGKKIATGGQAIVFKATLYGESEVQSTILLTSQAICIETIRRR